jgi:hypothetical protein
MDEHEKSSRERSRPKARDGTRVSEFEDIYLDDVKDFKDEKFERSDEFESPEVDKEPI